MRNGSEMNARQASSEQPRNHAVIVHVYVESRRGFGQAGHIHDVPGKDNDESGAAVKLHIAHGEDIGFRRAEQRLER